MGIGDLVLATKNRSDGKGRLSRHTRVALAILTQNSSADASWTTCNATSSKIPLWSNGDKRFVKCKKFLHIGRRLGRWCMFHKGESVWHDVCSSLVMVKTPTLIPERSIMNKSFVLVAAVMTLSALPASASTVVITPADTSWRVIPNGPTDGTATITNAAPRSGNGSLELTGDRTRFAYGTIFPNAGSAHIAELSNVSALTFDWRIAGDAVPLLNPDYTPALRLSIFDSASGSRKDLVWEGAYNGTYGNTLRDTWYSTTASSLFYLNGTSVNDGRTIAAWVSAFGANSFVGGISVGQGSSAGVGYHAFVDNVTLTTTSGSTTYNFETAAAAVPEPATWGMIIAGFGMMGASMRYRRRSAKVTFA